MSLFFSTMTTGTDTDTCMDTNADKIGKIFCARVSQLDRVVSGATAA
jgi:hypothetical protein